MIDTYALLAARLCGFALGASAPEIPAQTDFDRLFSISRLHSVAPLVAYALEKLGVDCGAVAEKFSRETKKAVFRCAVREVAADEIRAALDENGIAYTFLKGSVLMKLYPEPHLRTMCDLDIRYDTSKAEAVDNIMLSLGYTKVEESGTGGLNKAYTRPPCVRIEMHGHLMDKDIPLYNGYFGNDFERTLPGEGCEKVFKDEDFFVFMLAHMAKHYFTGGTGIRSFTDIKAFLQSKPMLDLDYVERELKKIELDKFFLHMRKAADYMLDGAEPDELTSEIAEFIFDSNTYGKQQNMQTYAVKSRSSFVFGRLFPKLDFMSIRYPVLKKAPVLLPLFWIVRLVSSLFGGRWQNSDVDAAVRVDKVSLDARKIEGKPYITHITSEGDTKQ